MPTDLGSPGNNAQCASHSVLSGRWAALPGKKAVLWKEKAEVKNESFKDPRSKCGDCRVLPEE